MYIRMFDLHQLKVFYCCIIMLVVFLHVHQWLKEDEDQGVTPGTTAAGFQFTPVTSAVPVGGFNF